MLNFNGMKATCFLFFIITTSVTIMSCSKGGTANDTDLHIVNLTDTIPPILEINTPLPNQVFTGSNTINVTGKITDESGLYRGSVNIVNDANGDVLKEQLYEIHGILSYNFNVAYTPSVTTVSNYTVTVSFEDHGLNTTTQSIKVKVNP
jgi:hypothetical protein